MLDEFLVAEEWAGLMQYAFDHRDDFCATGVVSVNGSHQVDRDYRRSSVLFDLGGYRDVFVQRILVHLPRVLSGLNYPEFPVSEVEVQLTATNNGEFFRRHNDNGADSLRSRLITFVYFFYREPRPFDGGEICIYDTSFEDGAYQTTGHCTVITPTQNQILFFVSDCLHEVLPVQCASNEIFDSRFTVNGWLHG
jgi:Rps23 Pro-64 3,4-dihydroxylase Tpa1-like proline 4-hydroxylase